MIPLQATLLPGNENSIFPRKSQETSTMFPQVGGLLGHGNALAGLNTIQQAIHTNNIAVQQMVNMFQKQQQQQFQVFPNNSSLVNMPCGMPVQVYNSPLNASKKIKLEPNTLPLCQYPALGAYTNSILGNNDFSALAQANFHQLKRTLSDESCDSKVSKRRKICQHLEGCNRFSRGSSGLCIRHGGERADARSLCAHSGGCNKGAQGPTNLCKIHGGGQRCQHRDCTKSSQGPSKFCIRHGGGRRCLISGCTKSAQGKTQKCKAHGGGKRCHVLDCPKSAQGATNFCKAHGGGKRCIQPGCTKAARGKTDYCVAHGGGKRCQKPYCTKSAVRPQYVFCTAHGGGKRCSFNGCSKGARYGTDYCRHHGTLLRRHQEKTEKLVNQQPIQTLTV
mmetsp:Transcript_14158/g.16423  ORF Transcript_14158/g.16423 Transcript_14158/m.16423 type:complete len:391 (+) Transcript_14158:152-1324(+)